MTMRHFWWNVNKNFATGTRMRTKNLLHLQPNQRNRHQSLNHGNPISVNMVATTETIGTETIIVQTTEITITIGIMIIVHPGTIDNTTIDHTIGISDVMVMVRVTVLDHRIININQILKQIHHH